MHVQNKCMWFQKIDDYQFTLLHDIYTSYSIKRNTRLIFENDNSLQEQCLQVDVGGGHSKFCGVCSTWWIPGIVLIFRFNSPTTDLKNSLSKFKLIL